VAEGVAGADADNIGVAAGFDEGAGAAAAAGKVAGSERLGGDLIEAGEQRRRTGGAGARFAIEELRIEEGKLRAAGALGAIEEEGMGWHVAAGEGAELALDRFVADDGEHGCKSEEWRVKREERRA
jgi:hypothetical protein